MNILEFLISLDFYYWFMVGMFVIGLMVFISLFFTTAGYGQHYEGKLKKVWGILGDVKSDKLGWIIMELPVFIVYLIFFLLGKHQDSIVTLIFSMLFLMHYGYRTFIFPILIRGKHEMPWMIILFGMLFNTANAYLQGRWINSIYRYESTWLLTPFFIIGIIIFVAGFVIHVHSDHIIRNLRKPGEDEFKVPYGGMFEYVSCPSYLGEITEWTGWAIMTWSLPGLVFALWTFFNLAPRARSNHKWYQDKFSNYPDDRKALIPFIF